MPSAVTEGDSRIDIVIEQGCWTKAHAASVRAAAEAALKAEPAASVVILLTDDAAVQALNRQFRGKDKPTNVLSFPAADMPGLEAFLGDIAIAFETVQREAADEAKTFGDHVSHLVIHGLLHLLGEDHETAEEAEAMEAVERTLLASLGIADPYQDTVPADGH